MKVASEVKSRLAKWRTSKPNLHGVVFKRLLKNQYQSDFCTLKARLHRRFLSQQLDAIFVAAKSH